MFYLLLLSTKSVSCFAFLLISEMRRAAGTEAHRTKAAKGRKVFFPPFFFLSLFKTPERIALLLLFLSCIWHKARASSLGIAPPPHSPLKRSRASANLLSQVKETDSNEVGCDKLLHTFCVSFATQ